MSGLVIILAGAIAGSTGASAQSTPVEAGARFSIQPIDGGVLRLDTATGAVSICTRREASWSCEPVADKAVAPTELDRLKAQNLALRAEVERLERELRDRTSDAPKPKFELPSEEDVDKAMSYVERLLKKFRDRLKALEDTSPPARDKSL